MQLPTSCFIPKVFAVKLPLSYEVAEKHAKRVVVDPIGGMGHHKFRTFSNMFTSKHVAQFEFRSVSSDVS